MNTFRDNSVRFTVIKPYNYNEFLYTRRAALIPKQISLARALKEMKPGMAWHGGTQVLRGLCKKPT